MKKNIYLSILSSLFLIYVVSFRSYAVSPESIQSIEYGLQSLEMSGLYDSGVAPVDLPISASANYHDVINQVAGRNTATTLSSSDFTYYDSIPYDVVDSVQNWEFKDNNGNNVSFSALGYATFDNGYYSGSCLYNTVTGDIVYRWNETQSSSKPICDIKHGGSILSAQDWRDLYSDVYDSVTDQGYNYSLTDTSKSFNSSYYLCFGQTRGGSPASAESVFISNQYLPGLIVPTITNNGDTIQSWYTNDLNLIQHNQVFGSISTYSVTSGNYSKGGYNYNYYVTVGGGLGFGWVTQFGDLTSFIAGDPNQNSLCFGRTGYFYSSDLYNDSIPFQPTDGMKINVGSSYALDDVIAGVGSWSDTAPVRNPTYDPSLPVSVSNYPIAITDDDTIASNPSIPVSSNPAIELDPSISYPLEQEIVIPSVNTFDIPIISDLQYRFPFSIPWDLKNMLKGLRSSATAPRFQGDLYIAPIDYTYHIDIDLSMFDEQAELFRLLFLIAFIIGLARFSYTHFFGT